MYVCMYVFMNVSLKMKSDGKKIKIRKSFAL